MKRLALFWIALLVFIILTVICARRAEGKDHENINILVVPAYFSDQSPAYTSKVQLEALMAEVQAWYAASSYGQLSIGYHVMEPFAINHPTGLCLDRSWEGDALAAASRAGFVGDKVMFFYNDPNCPYGGEAYLGGTVFRVKVANPQIIEHELGHSIGWSHDQRLDIGGGAGGVVVMDPAKVRAYGGSFGVMGGGSSTATALDRARAGWLTVRRLPRVPYQRVHLEPIYDPPGDAVSIVREDGFTLYLERREPKGLDSNLAPSIIVSSDFFYQTLIDALVNEDELNDVIGGERIRYLGAGDIDVWTFPGATPTPFNPNAPTPAPLPGDFGGPTPGPGPCWGPGMFAPCTPTPGAPTPTPTPIVPEVVIILPSPPTDTPTPEPTATATPTEIPTPEPTATKLPAPPPTLPSLPKGRGGCFGFTAFSVGAILVGMRLQRGRR